ncbi:MAG: Gfo/Idh/MocA family protein [Candidatus Binataceae bacterium]
MADKRPLRFGTLGAALITPNALIKPVHEVPEAALVAVAARDRKRAEEFAATHGIPRVHATYEDVINDPEVDAIYNPLPNSHHCEWTIAALRAGKDVLCEKPLASNAAEAQRMADVAKETGRFLGEAFHYRYHPLAERVRGIIKGLGRLQRLEANFSVPIPPTNIRFDWSLAGGATMDLGCYPLHMLREFSGLMPRVLKASAKTGPKNIDVAMEVDLEMAGGVSARMTCSMAQEAVLGATFTATGDRGELTIVNPVGPHYGNQITLKTADGTKQETVAGDATYTYQLRAFVAQIRGEKTFPTDGAEGVINMRIIDDVYRAAGLPPRGT